MANDREGEKIAPVLAFPTAPSSATHDEQAERPKVRDAIGAVLREERLEQERILSEVADEAAVSLAYLSEIERGRKEVSSDLLESVSDALGIEVADVLERAADRLRAQSIVVGRIGMDRRPEFRLAA